jgi:predicted TIM-barrel fold metal-dependent hydrolase
VINDAHVHFRGGETAKRTLVAMDSAGIEKIAGISPNPGADADSQREGLESMRPILGECNGRVYGMAYINPILEDAADLVEWAVTDLGFRGIKMAPDHWYPYDDRMLPVYERIEKLGVPILFHSGILWANRDSSRFCQPVNFEVLINYPGIRFSLAHIGWPWTDECIAVGGRFAATVVDPEVGLQEHAPRPSADEPYAAQMFVDITLGAPRPYRRAAISKALAVLGDYRILYGSDCDKPEDPEVFRFHSDVDRGIFIGELGQSEETLRRIMHDNFEHLFTG